MKLKRKNKGITLIALVVTIVVLLIIAGISISVLTGDNGIIGQSKEAKEQTEIAEERETVELSATQAAGKNKFGEVTESNLREALDKNIGINKYDLEIKTGKFIVIYKDSKREYQIDKDGTIVVGKGSGKTFDDILEDLKSNKDEYLEQAKDKGQDESNTDIGIGTDKEVVNLDLWRYFKTDDGLGLSLGKKVNSSGEIGYIGEIYSGKIQGEVPQYIYLAEEDKTYPVIAMMWTFAGNQELVYAPVIPDTVNILYYTFNGCKKLTNITIPNSVTSIGDYTFNYCECLTDIIIPNSVTSIGIYAFANCMGLTSINIPISVASIGHEAFEYWTESQTINCEAPEKPDGWDDRWDDYELYSPRKAQCNWGVK